MAPRVSLSCPATLTAALAFAKMGGMHIEPGKTRIGWIGTGVMGASMCGHLIRAGFAATVFNRTRAKAEPLLASRGTLGR